METLSMLILNDIDELNSKLQTLRNTMETAGINTSGVKRMIAQTKLLRINGIYNADVVRDLRKEKLTLITR